MKKIVVLFGNCKKTRGKTNRQTNPCNPIELCGSNLSHPEGSNTWTIWNWTLKFSGGIWVLPIDRGITTVLTQVQTLGGHLLWEQFFEKLRNFTKWIKTLVNIFATRDYSANLLGWRNLSINSANWSRSDTFVEKYCCVHELRTNESKYKFHNNRSYNLQKYPLKKPLENNALCSFWFQFTHANMRPQLLVAKEWIKLNCFFFSGLPAIHLHCFTIQWNFLVPLIGGR